MSDSDLEEIRRQLATLCRRQSARVIGQPPDRPSRFNPGTVVDPRWDMPFTEAGAWKYIARLLENDHPIERVQLDKPPGSTAYVMKVELHENKPELYIKVQLGAGKVIGRSFHYTESPEEREE